MIFNDYAVVLRRANTRETDRIACVYTKTRGRLMVRFPGVNRAAGKLKALAEPLACGEYRIHWRGGALTGVAAGGKLLTVFPGVRADFGRLSLALHFCELVYRMTPQAQPNPGKYELLYSALACLDSRADIPLALRQAFTLRLMKLAGYGLERPVLGIEPRFWRALHEEDFNKLDFSDEADLEYLSRADSVLRRFAASHFERPLNTIPPETAHRCLVGV